MHLSKLSTAGPGGRLSRTMPLIIAALIGLGGCSDGTTGPSGGNGGTNGPEPYDHARAPGASARDLLSAESFDRVVVEVQYVDGASPTAEALDSLRTFLEVRLNKPGGIVIQSPQQIAITQQAPYSAGDVRAIEGEHRTAFTESTTLAVYMLFLDGEYEDDPNVLGIAYNNTSTAIFGEKIRQYSDGLNQPPRARVEATVASHELGHLMGLVNNGSDMVTEHQDEQHGRHCDDENCLMYYAVDTTSFLLGIFDEIPSLDQDCIDDLQANGGA